MAKKDKKIDSIDGIGKDTSKFIVQKSKPLFALWRSSLTLAEFKILDIYLARINSHDPQHRTVRFKKGELESVLEIQQLKPEVLDKRLEHLMTSVRIPEANNELEITRINLFSKAHAKLDEFGMWEAELTCTPEAEEYFFNVESIRYLRYKLKNIVNIKSRYAYIMFLYIWENKYMGTWEVPLGELKTILNCDQDEYCKKFKVFNDRVLKRIHKEICEVTDICYDYKPIKEGRSVVAIRFEYKSKKVIDIEDYEHQITLEELHPQAHHPLWEAPLSEWKLSQEKLDELAALLETIPKSKLPDAEDTEQSKYKYIALKAAEIKRRSQEKRISNRFAYLKKMIDADMQKVQSTTDQKSNQFTPSGTLAFRNFTERKNNNYMDKLMAQYKHPNCTDQESES